MANKVNPSAKGLQGVQSVLKKIDKRGTKEVAGLKNDNRRTVSESNFSELRGEKIPAKT